MQLTREYSQEQDAVDMLTGMMGGGVGLNEARRVLRKHKGDVQKAADAILEGDRGEEEPPSWQTHNAVAESSQDIRYTEPLSHAQHATPTSSSPIIDLTGDDNDFATRPWQFDQAHSGVTFGPSNRAPDPAWQMVTTNQQTQSAQEDRSLKDAIQASLADFNAEELEVFPVEKTVREGGRPIALRSEVPGHAHAALVLQALFHVPHIRHHIANLRLRASDPEVALDKEDEIDPTLWSLVELFANLDLAQLSSIIDKEVLPSLSPDTWDGTSEHLHHLSIEFIRSLGQQIEIELRYQSIENELEARPFRFIHCSAEVDMDANTYKADDSTVQESWIVSLEVGDTSVPNDLLSRLNCSLISDIGSGRSRHDVICDPSELVIFQLTPSRLASTSAGKSLEPFSFPKQFFLDRFMLENIPVTSQKRAQEQEMFLKIDELTRRKEFITRCDNRDTLQDLRGTLHYYENVADTKDDPERKVAVSHTTQQLRNIINKLISEAHEIDIKIEELQSEATSIFDDLMLQKLQYDLRAVLMHTGLPGRKQIYSYIQDTRGTWWKTMDFNVTEVPEETVLTDPTGFHLGAGPYLLIYSRHLTDEQMAQPAAWPQAFVDAVEASNKTFMAYLSPDLASKPIEATNMDTMDPIQSSQSMTTPYSSSVTQENGGRRLVDVSDNVLL